jgi:hypothetical protein
MVAVRHFSMAVLRLFFWYGVGRADTAGGHGTGSR